MELDRRRKEQQGRRKTIPRPSRQWRSGSSSTSVVAVMRTSRRRRSGVGEFSRRWLRSLDRLGFLGFVDVGGEEWQLFNS